MTAADTLRRAVRLLALALFLTHLAPAASGETEVPSRSLDSAESAISAESTEPAAPALPGASSELSPQFLVGLRVRIATTRRQPPDLRLDGRVLGLDGTHMVIEPADPQKPRVVLPTTSIQRLEIYRGQKRRTLRGFRIGAASVGIPLAVIGGLAALAVCRDAEWNCDGGETGKFAIYTAAFGGGVGTAIGGGVGAAIGATTKEDAWRSAKTPLVRPLVSVQPSREGVKVALTFRF